MLQLPASFFAYRKQQHRWTCGPVQLWRKAAQDIWTSGLPLSRKLELILCYFGLRKVATHWVSLGFFCTLVPLSVFTPEVRACRSGSWGADLPEAKAQHAAGNSRATEHGVQELSDKQQRSHALMLIHQPSRRTSL